MTLGMDALHQIAEIMVVGVGLASGWFYARSLLDGNLTKQAVIRWSMTTVPMGISIAWALKTIGILCL